MRTSIPVSGRGHAGRCRGHLSGGGRAALEDELAEDPRVVLMGQDVGVLGGAFRATAGLLERFASAASSTRDLRDRARSAPPSAWRSAACGHRRASSSPTSSRARTTSWSPSPRRPTTASASRSHRGARAIGRRARRRPVPQQNREGVFAHSAGLKVVCPGTRAGRGTTSSAPHGRPNPCSSSSTRRCTARSGAARPRAAELRVRPRPRGPPRPPT